MYKPLVAFALAAALAGCAGTAPGAATAAEDCRTVAQDDTDSHIKVRRDCNSAEEQGSSRPSAQPQTAG